MPQLCPEEAQEPARDKSGNSTILWAGRTASPGGEAYMLF